MREPSFQSPRWVLSSDSPEASTANQSAPFSITVRQQPEQAIEAPITTGFMSCLVRMTKRRSPACPAALTAVVSPVLVTVPGDKLLLLFLPAPVSVVRPPPPRSHPGENPAGKRASATPKG